MLLWWSISWTPYALVFLAAVTGQKQLITQHTDMLPGKLLLYMVLIITHTILQAVFSKLSVAANPFIYGLI